MSSELLNIIGSSAAIRHVLRQVRLVAPTDETVLIQGETGTGKEMIAGAIHELSPRSQSPLIKLNCAAIPSGLLEANSSDTSGAPSQAPSRSASAVSS